jgi:type IV secretory pathway VirJ component
VSTAFPRVLLCGALSLVAALTSGCTQAPLAPGSPNGSSLNFGHFGRLHVIRPGTGGSAASDATPHDVVLFLSDADGWTPAVAAVAQRVAAHDAIVVGIDLRHYFAQLEKSPEPCVSPATDFENLNHYLQSKLALKRFVQPTLLGVAAGGTLAYATLAQAPDGQFKGALSIDFRPELALRKPLCRGAGLEQSPWLGADGARSGVRLLPASALSGAWSVVQQAGHGPTPAALAAYEGGSAGDVALLPAGGGELAPPAWLAQEDAAFGKLVARAERSAAEAGSAVADLPLTLVKASAGGTDGWFAIFLTGDGGWVGLDRGVSAELARHDIPVVGWDSLKYFWTARTPEGASQDLDRVVRYYAREWHRSRVLLIGYSQGADTMPFMVNRLPAQTRAMVGLTALLGISDNALFQFHVSNWLGSATGGIPTQPEVRKWSGSPWLCLYGERDKDAACQLMAGGDGSIVKMSGDHHFGGRYVDIAAEILAHLPDP